MKELHGAHEILDNAQYLVTRNIWQCANNAPDKQSSPDTAGRAERSGNPTGHGRRASPARLAEQAKAQPTVAAAVSDAGLASRWSRAGGPGQHLDPGGGLQVVLLPRRAIEHVNRPGRALRPGRLEHEHEVVLRPARVGDDRAVGALPPVPEHAGREAAGRRVAP